MSRAGSRRTRGFGAGAALGIAVLVLAVPAAFGHLTPAGDPSYASLDTGSVHIDVPAALPHVDLTQDANTSIGASLVLDRIVEVTNSPTDPQIVAKATVSDARSFNASGATGPHLLVGLSANLTVFQSSGDLFPPPDAQGHVTVATPIAPTTIVVTVLTTASAGTVSVAVAINGWPWVSPTDVLAVGWQFQVAQASGFSGCSRAVATSVPAADCGADPFATANSTWNASLDGIQGVTAAGPRAQLAWGPSVLTPGGGVPVITGAQRTLASPGSAEVVLGASAHGASSVEYQLSYALALPTLSNDLVRGSLLPYLAGGAAAAILAVGAVGYARRRDRQVLETL